MHAQCPRCARNPGPERGRKLSAFHLPPPCPGRTQCGLKAFEARHPLLVLHAHCALRLVVPSALCISSPSRPVGLIEMHLFSDPSQRLESHVPRGIWPPQVPDTSVPSVCPQQRCRQQPPHHTRTPGSSLADTATQWPGQQLHL